MREGTSDFGAWRDASLARAAAAAAAAALVALAACIGGEVADTAPVEAIGSVREIYDGALAPDAALRTFRNTERLFATRVVSAGPSPRPLPLHAQPLRDVYVPVGADSLPLDSVLVLNRVTGFLVLRDGQVLFERYRGGNTAVSRWMSMSVAKSVLGVLVGAALRDGHLRSLDTAITALVPSLRGSAWEGVTLRHAIAMRSGLAWTEAYADSSSDRRRLLEAQLAQQPGAMDAVLRSLRRDVPPGTRTVYSTGETQVVAMALRAAVGMPLAEYLSARVWGPAGMARDAEWWLDAPGGVEIGGSGLVATLRDYGRFGQFVLERGIVGRDTILPPWYVDSLGRKSGQVFGADYSYGWLWWPLTKELPASHRAFTAEGIHGQFILVDPLARVVIVQWAARPEAQGGEQISDYDVFAAVIRAALR